MQNASQPTAGSVASRMALTALMLLLPGCAARTTPAANVPQTPSHAVAGQAAATGAPVSQKSFANADDAVNALVIATRNDNKPELLRILGAEGAPLVSSGDAVADRDSRDHFLSAYDQMHRLDTAADGRVNLVVGEDEWPLPIPLVQANGVWSFDTPAGKEEILDRRIGRNELNVMGVCRAYVEAQMEFAAQTPRSAGGHEYATRFHSSPGKHDGLYWPATDDEQESPLGLLVADATAEGYNHGTPGRHEPYHGYYYRILKRQGAHASGGAKDYMVKGHMTGGFALIAWPSRYGDSGIMTFIVNRSGIVYEKNLGPDTSKIVNNIHDYDPDDSWKVVSASR